MESLPFSQACENNKTYILDVLREVFAGRHKVLEIGSGTGQHACYFARQMPWLQWQPSDLRENLPTLRHRCAAYPGANLLPDVALDVCDKPWGVEIPDALFTANSLHIMSFNSVQRLFSALAESERADIVLAIYGPFNYQGAYTSDSNARFDQWLMQRDPDSGIRDFEAVNELAERADFCLLRDYEMPANNRLLVWERKQRGAPHRGSSGPRMSTPGQ